MAKRRSHASRPRRTHRRRGRKGFIAQTTGAVRRIGYGMARVAGPAMVGGAGALLLVPAVEPFRDIGKVVGGDFGTIQTDLRQAGSNIKTNAAAAAVLGIGGIVVTKVVGSALRG